MGPRQWLPLLGDHWERLPKWLNALGLDFLQVLDNCCQPQPNRKVESLAWILQTWASVPIHGPPFQVKILIKKSRMW